MEIKRLPPPLIVEFESGIEIQTVRLRSVGIKDSLGIYQHPGKLFYAIRRTALRKFVGEILGAVRYQKAIRTALPERLERERRATKPDAEVVRRLAFLKADVVIFVEPTNERAIFPDPRKEAKRWNAVEKLCKPL